MDALTYDAVTSEALEFERVRQEIALGCLTEEGRLAVLSETVSSDFTAVESLKRSVKPWFSLLTSAAGLPSQDFPPVTEALARCAPEGSRLDGRALKFVARYISSASDWKRYLASSTVEGLSIWALRLGDFSGLAHELHRVLDDQGDLVEAQIPTLLVLRSELSRDRSEIDQTAKALLRDDQWGDVWQDQTPTEKDGRTVLPLKANFKGRVGAVVHDSSATGQTLFVEPYALVERNNRLVEHQLALRAEILRVLKELTERVRSQREGLLSLVSAVTDMDTLLCRAKWGLAHRGALVVSGRPAQPWALLQARHPLLGTSAVPIDVKGDKQTRVVLLSGPNTGGKTVSLKTLGLLSLLHQFGVPIPTAPESVLPVWDRVMTDIGDHQSLDQALSTFSSHMNRMAQILLSTTDQSLVLLDEMASGTDPQEGGALGMAFLDHFLAQGATVFGTTHHGALKNFAFTHAGARNASVEFDEGSGAPTYRILPDVPGPSHALETAQRVGIPEALVIQARKILEGNETDVAAVIKTLRDKHEEMKRREGDLASRERSFREERRRIDLLALRLKQKEAELKQSGLGEVNRFVVDSRKAFERLVKEIREGTLNTEKIKEVRAFLAETEKEAQLQNKQVQDDLRVWQQDDADQGESMVSPLPPDWTEGLSVVVEPGKQPGTLVRKAGKGRWVVAMGSVKLTVNEASLRAAKAKKNERISVALAISESSEPPAFSLDLRGMRWEEARIALEKQVDRALLSGLQEFSIVHGLGEGVLQKVVQDYLRTRKEVKKYFFSLPEEGGFGKTVVQI